MQTYFVRRLLWIPILLLGITLLDFTFINLAPGDPITSMISPETLRDMPPEFIEARKQALGLNDPIPVRYIKWLGELLQGNLGYSISRVIAVSEIMKSAWQSSILIVLPSLIISTTLGILLGILSALRPYSLIDYVLTILAFIVPATPSFFIAMGLIYLGALKLQVFPTSGLYTPGQEATLVDVAHHLVLPVLALALGGVGDLMRYTRASLLEVLQQDYIVTARSKGLRESSILYRHTLRNALLPIVTVIGLSLPTLFGGAFLIETIFNIPGMGSVMVTATTKQDYPLMMGGLLLTAITILVATFITDIAYALIDPRIRFGN